MAENSSRSATLYRRLSSIVENSVFDENLLHRSASMPLQGITHQNLTEVVPSKAVTDSLRVRDTRDGTLLRDEESRDTDSAVEGFRDRDWMSFVVVYTMIFFNGCCFTAVVPSVPFYLEVLGAPPSFLGWVVSFYSLGQIVGSPTAGFLADKLSSRRMLTISSTLGLISSSMYTVAPNHWFILASRFLTGVSAGTEFTTELAYIARNTTATERTTFLASITAVNVVGFIMGPALTTVLATLDFTIFGLAVNKYTGPGWLLVIMFLVDIIMVQTIFKDAGITTTSKDDASEAAGLLNGKEDSSKPAGYGSLNVSGDKSTDGESSADEPPPSLTIVATLIFVQFTVMCAWSVLETITSPLASDAFDWHVQECNLLFTCGGFISLVAYVAFVVASKWAQDRYLIFYALTLCFIGLMLMIDWTKLVWFPQWIYLPTYKKRFLAGYMIMNAGFMTGRPVTFALYSKLVPSQYQGKYLGWMVAGGSAARTLGPFAAVFLYYRIPGIGNNLLVLFGTEALFQTACLVLVVLFWRQLVPAGTEKRFDEDRSTTSSEDKVQMSMHSGKRS